MSRQLRIDFPGAHRRVGHLFQGRFKNILVERKSHLLELTRYIVLNPVRCGAVKYAGDWKWSNYGATAGLSSSPSWLETDWTLAKLDPWDRAQAREAYRRFVAEARGSEYKPWGSLVGQIYLGGEAFCEMVQKIVDSQPTSRRAYPRAQVELVRPAFDHVIELVMEEFSRESPSSEPAPWAKGARPSRIRGLRTDASNDRRVSDDLSARRFADAGDSENAAAKGPRVSPNSRRHTKTYNLSSDVKFSVLSAGSGVSVRVSLLHSASAMRNPVGAGGKSL